MPLAVAVGQTPGQALHTLRQVGGHQGKADQGDRQDRGQVSDPEEEDERDGPQQGRYALEKQNRGAKEGFQDRSRS